MFSYCADSLVKSFTDTQRRNQRIGIIHSVKLQNGLWLTRADFKPFVNSKLIKHHSEKSFISWCTAFSYNYASLCSLHIILSGKPFRMSSLMFEKKSAIFAASKIKRGKPIIFLADKIRENISNAMLYGPFCSGIISSMLCFS